MSFPPRSPNCDGSTREVCRPDLYSAPRIRAMTFAGRCADRSGAKATRSVELRPANRPRGWHRGIRDTSGPFCASELTAGEARISAIARDLERRCGVGGYLTELRRTRVGPFFLSDATTLEKLAEEGVGPHLREFPEVALKWQA